MAFLANGYGRSDSIIVYYLQKAKDAKRSYATIVGVNTSFSGDRKGNFIELSDEKMVAFIRNFYDRCQVDPRDVEYVECYGCGLKVSGLG